MAMFSQGVQKVAQKLYRLFENEVDEPLEIHTHSEPLEIHTHSEISLGRYLSPGMGFTCPEALENVNSVLQKEPAREAKTIKKSPKLRTWLDKAFTAIV